MESFSLHRKTRAGSSNKTEVQFLDFVVSGRSLYDELCRRGYDYVSCLGWLVAEYDREARERLTLKAQSDLPDGRCALFICPECADLGCGAISAHVTQDGDWVTWSNIGYENNYEDGYISEDQLGPFVFSASEYIKAIESAT